MGILEDWGITQDDLNIVLAERPFYGDPFELLREIVRERRKL